MKGSNCVGGGFIGTYRYDLLFSLFLIDLLIFFSVRFKNCKLSSTFTVFANFTENYYERFIIFKNFSKVQWFCISRIRNWIQTTVSSFALYINKFYLKGNTIYKWIKIFQNQRTWSNTKSQIYLSSFRKS